MQKGHRNIADLYTIYCKNTIPGLQVPKDQFKRVLKRFSVLVIDKVLDAEEVKIPIIGTLRVKKVKQSFLPTKMKIDYQATKKAGKKAVAETEESTEDKPKKAAAKKTATPKAPKTATPKVDPTFKDERDGQVYKTAIIDGKTWMIEPFRHKPAKCDCIYWEEKDTTKGAFYTAAQAKMVVPVGWRIPTTEEYEALMAKVGTTQEAFTKAGFAVEFLRFDLAMYKTIRQYKNDAYMTKVLVGDKKAFYISENAYFLALKIFKSKAADGSDYETVSDYALLVEKDKAQISGGAWGNYFRMFLIKE